MTRVVMSITVERAGNKRVLGMRLGRGRRLSIML
jgi:hypothetical protein